MDCIYYKLREEGRISNRAAYVVLGIATEGYKEILSITVGANETSKFWMGMLNDLKNRGLQDLLFFCVDGLNGFKKQFMLYSTVQRCIIHLLWNSFQYVSFKDLHFFAADFKKVYRAPNETLAWNEFEQIKKTREKKYLHAIRNWENK